MNLIGPAAASGAQPRDLPRAHRLLRAALDRAARRHRLGAGALRLRQQPRGRNREDAVRPVLHQEPVAVARLPHRRCDGRHRAARPRRDRRQAEPDCAASTRARRSWTDRAAPGTCAGSSDRRRREGASDQRSPPRRRRLVAARSSGAAHRGRDPRGERDGGRPLCLRRAGRVHRSSCCSRRRPGSRCSRACASRSWPPGWRSRRTLVHRLRQPHATPPRFSSKSAIALALLVPGRR